MAKVGRTLGVSKTFTNDTQFKKGVYDPRRDKGQFKKGNWQGKASQEEWINTKDERMAQKELTKRVYTMITKTHLEMTQRAREKAEKLIELLETIAFSDDSSENAKLAAAQQLLDRAYGKSTQMNVNSNMDAGGRPKDISARDLDRRIDETIRRVEGTPERVQEEAAGPEGPPDLRKYN